MRKIKQIIFDADDTLWENNIYYLKATNDFFDLAEKEGISRSQAEKAFDELELKVVNELGYGSSNFHKLNKPKLIEYVTELMEQLSHKYKLYILTKGDPHEQESKIIKSGLSKMVVKYFILDEKDDKAYAQLLSAQNWQPNETCMIGNSPKSDINPALRNNMYAIHIPYKNTWKVDIEPIINKNGKYIKINNFEELKNIFLFE
ncbi:MAG: HAD-IA family hydrolase [Calditrichaceae bacterium]